MVASGRVTVTVAGFIAVDILLNILSLSWHGNEFSFSNIGKQFDEKFTFLRSTIDLLFLLLIRSVLLCVGCVILCFVSEPLNRLKQLAHFSFSYAIISASISPAKLLALSEDRNVLFVGDWMILVENLVFSVLAHSVWKFFVKNAVKDTEEYERLNEVTEETEETEEEGAGQSTAVVIVRILQYCRDEWIWHISGFVWLFIYSLTRIFVPYYTGQVIASVVSSSGDKYTSLISSIKLMIAISIISALSGGLRGGSFEYAYARINRAVRNDLFGSLVRQDVAFFDKHKTGEITSRLTADTQTMSDTVALNVNIFLRNIVQMGGSMLFMLALCWKLSLVPFIVVPIIIVASQVFGVYYDFLSEKTQAAVAQSNDVAEEVISTMRTVRSFACEDLESERFYDRLTFTLKVTRQKAFAYVAFVWVSELFQAVINIAVLWYGGNLVLKGELQKDLLVSFLLYQMQLANNIRELSEVWTGLMQSVGASRKVFGYIDRIPQLKLDGNYAPKTLEGRIVFENVNFSYPMRPQIPILKDLSFTVEPGEVAALVGPSGSGKSSCIALLEHFYEPSRGRVLIDGVPLVDYDHRFIHNAIALVGQEPILFGRSVAENIRYGLDECSRAEIEDAAKLANAHGFITNTVAQYETNVGEKGAQMSGGQKQRIAIARALVRRPAILLLDEATSALDTESEHLVQEAIYKNLNGRTVILIAHRLSTVEKADKIIVIEKGVVAQIGSHEQLLSQDGIYRQLVQRQMVAGGEAPYVPSTSTRTSQYPSRGMNISPRSMAQSLLATSFTQSATSFQSK